MSYCALSKMTVDLPLSAGTMASDVSDCICLRAFNSSGFRLLVGVWLLTVHLQCGPWLYSCLPERHVT